MMDKILLIQKIDILDLKYLQMINLLLLP